MASFFLQLSLLLSHPSLAKPALQVSEMQLSLLPIGSLFRDPGPYKNLFANLGSYWVFISLKKTLLLPFCHFEREKDQKYLKIMYTFKRKRSKITFSGVVLVY